MFIGFFVLWHIKFFGLFNAKVLEEQQGYSLTYSWGFKGVLTFPKGNCPKGDVITQLEIAYGDSAVQRFNQYPTRTPPLDVECEF